MTPVISPPLKREVGYFFCKKIGSSKEQVCERYSIIAGNNTYLNRPVCECGQRSQFLEKWHFLTECCPKCIVFNRFKSVFHLIKGDLYQLHKGLQTLIYQSLEVMRPEGLEPSQVYTHCPLKTARLPFRHDRKRRIPNRKDCTTTE